MPTSPRPRRQRLKFDFDGKNKWAWFAMFLLWAVFQLAPAREALLHLPPTISAVFKAIGCLGLLALFYVVLGVVCDYSTATIEEHELVIRAHRLGWVFETARVPIERIKDVILNIDTSWLYAPRDPNDPYDRGTRSGPIPCWIHVRLVDESEQGLNVRYATDVAAEIARFQLAKLLHAAGRQSCHLTPARSYSWVDAVGEFVRAMVRFVVITVVLVVVFFGALASSLRGGGVGP